MSNVVIEMLNQKRERLSSLKQRSRNWAIAVLALFISAVAFATAWLFGVVPIASGPILYALLAMFVIACWRLNSARWDERMSQRTLVELTQRHSGQALC